MQLERVPHVGSLLQVLYVAVQAAECGGHRQHPILKLTEIQCVELLQFVCKGKYRTKTVTENGITEEIKGLN
jgi:hypothetical protein